MADEPKPDTPQPTPTPDAASPNISPAPSAVTDGKPAAADAAAPAPGAAGTGVPASPNSTGPNVPADPLSDGTVPTVLETGSSHKSVPKGRASITSIYRKADIMTTLITFVATVVAALAVFGVYAYLTRSKTPTTKTPAVTTLDKADLDKLGAFFAGNSAGDAGQVLTISASSLFQNRVAMNSDLKVVGGVEVTGTTALADLTVDKTSTLGITNVRGQLTVAGPSSLQGPTILGNGVSVTGNVTATGNGSFGGSVSAGVINTPTLSVAGTLNLSGHINLSGSAPTISSGSIDGTDTAGNFSLTGTTATVTFHTAYTKTPRILLTPTAACPGTGQFFVQATGGGSFVVNNPALCTSFNYWVVQ